MIRLNRLAVRETSTKDFPGVLVVRRGGDRSLGGGNKFLTMMPSCQHEGKGLYLISDWVPLGHFSCIRIWESFNLILEEVKNVILLLDGLSCGWSGVEVDPSAIILGRQGVPNADRAELVKQC